MICSILLPRGGHRDEVSYLEAFIVDSILTGRWIHIGYLMMMHMISCVESMTRVLSYCRFLTRVLKDVGVNLSREKDFEPPLAMTWPDLDIPLAPQSEGIHVEATFSEPMMIESSYTVGPSSQPSFTEFPHAELPS
ncbi:hypothetical protein CK203_056888 [Vitis vinifera]|uniref:Uncharacterized protein n=1 Tax=Vitis vinifera TaxID=29760 RepID=A0A438GW56_VITVI|nr:hypothetical protein CK203_056888 [Vitis vinifera]